MPKIIIHHPDGDTSKFELNKQLISIGRGPDNDIVLPDGTSSGNHAILKLGSEGDFSVTDLGSTNNTKVNGNKVQTFELLDGDTIHFGDTKVGYESEASKGKGGSNRKVSSAPRPPSAVPPPSQNKKLTAPTSFSPDEKRDGGAAKPKRSRKKAATDDGTGAGGCFALLMLPLFLIACLFAGMEVRHYFSTDRKLLHEELLNLYKEAQAKESEASEGVE